MTGEQDLQKLIESMEPDLHDGEFLFCTVSEEDLKNTRVSILALFRETEGITLIVPREEAELAGLSGIYPCRLITLNVHSSLEAVGFLAAITAKLAEAGISVNAVSAYFHDHLFIPAEKAEAAMKLLEEMSA